MKTTMITVCAALLHISCMAQDKELKQDGNGIQFSVIRAEITDKNLTDIQIDAAKKKYIGKSVAWQGWVENVVKSGDKYRCLVDFDSPEETFSLSEVEFFVDEKTAINISKNQVIFISGKIKSFSTFMGFQIRLDDIIYELK